MSAHIPFNFRNLLRLLAGSALIICCAFAVSNIGGTRLPEPKLDIPHNAGKTEQVAIFAGGCFWGIEAVFEHVKGVRDATSGYAGGTAETANYESVSAGNSGHAESVRVRFDPEKISYGQLLKVYFSVAHDPTQLNRQGPDTGTQYRSAIFYSNEQQKQIAIAYIAQLNAAKIFSKPIVTQVVPLKEFYAAEAYHQNYVRIHPYNPYIVINDLPKVVRLKQQFPTLYSEVK